MKYAARIFLLFWACFIISEAAHRISADAFSREAERQETFTVYESDLDYNTVRVTGRTRFVWVTDDETEAFNGLSQERISQGMNLKLSEAAGMDEEMLAGYIAALSVGEELAALGVTGAGLKSLDADKAVVCLERKDQASAERYFCQASGNTLSVFDEKRERLVLRQPLEKKRFSLEELRKLYSGLYLEDYDSIVSLLDGKRIGE